MDAQFETIIKKAVQEHGPGLFADARNCRATLADYAAGKCQFEIRRLHTILEADAYNQIISTRDIELTKDRLVQDIFNQYSMDRNLAREMIDFLAFVCGKGAPPSVSIPVSQPAPKPKPAPQPIPTPPSQPAPLPIPPDFVCISAGTFTMGSPSSEAGRGSNEVQHRVTISKAFYMSKYEVTQREYQEVMGSNPSYFKGDKLPVEQVSWYDVIDYCNKRSVKEGLTPAYTRNGDAVTWNKGTNGYRLPTEAEWEYACRAGTTTPFSTGNNITTDQANYDGNYPYNGNAKGTYRQKTWAVGSGTANAWGLYDMHGNVWEWCWDRYGAYDTANQTDPSSAASRSRRVYRGGSWGSYAAFLRSAGRSYGTSTNRSDYLGCRLVRP
ncbi:hypothetical protein FACS1894200_06820 [Spirochaetia bacterium]|nr:hypothetical protein FACS1894200_06820 [Spirochaetia bacterium]